MKKRELNEILYHISTGEVLKRLTVLPYEKRREVIRNMFVSEQELVNPNVVKNAFGLRVSFDELREDILAKTDVVGEINEDEDNCITLNERLRSEENKIWLRFTLAYELIALLLTHEDLFFEYHHQLRDLNWTFKEPIMNLVAEIIIDANKTKDKKDILNIEDEKLEENYGLPKVLIKSYKKELQNKGKVK